MQVRFKYSISGPSPEEVDPADYAGVGSPEELRMALLETIEDQVNWSASISESDLALLWEAVRRGRRLGKVLPAVPHS